MVTRMTALTADWSTGARVGRRGNGGRNREEKLRGAVGRARVTVDGARAAALSFVMSFAPFFA